MTLGGKKRTLDRLPIKLTKSDDSSTSLQGKEKNKTEKTKGVCISSTSIKCQSLLEHSAISFLSWRQTPIGYSLCQSLVSNYTPVRSNKK